MASQLYRDWELRESEVLVQRSDMQFAIGHVL